MIEKDQIKWIKDNPEETGTYGQIYYKGVRLDLSAETIQSIYYRSFSEEEVQTIISDSYKRCLRIHREKLLKQVLDDKNRK
jgi:hypothetical protein